MTGHLIRTIAPALGAALMLGVTGCTGAAPDDREQAATSTVDDTSTKEGEKMTAPAPNDDLISAVESGELDEVKSALEAGADADARNDRNRPALVIATRNDDVEVARALLDAGADPDAKDDLDDSAFLYAGAEGLDEILEAAIDHGADPTSVNRYGGTALIPASEHGHTSTVKILIEAGVPVDHVNNLSWTALHEAIVLGSGGVDHIETVRLLIEGGADVTIPDGQGVLPRDLAAQKGYTEIVDLIEAAD